MNSNRGAPGRWSGKSPEQIETEISISERREEQFNATDRVVFAGVFNCEFCKKDRDEHFRSIGTNKCTWCNGG